MTTYLLFNKDTPGERSVSDLAERLKKEEGLEPELLDADSPRGVQLAENYELLGRPVVLVVRDDGSPVQAWQGAELPTPAEIGYLNRQ